MSNEPHGEDSPDKEDSHHAKEVFEEFIESAIEAEQETGRHEITEKQAKRSLLARIFSIFFGVLVVILGLIMLVGPGPGLLMLAFGLGILAIDVPFARRLLLIVRNRLPQDSEGKLTQRTVLIMICTTSLGIIFSIVSIWLTFFRN